MQYQLRHTFVRSREAREFSAGRPGMSTVVQLSTPRGNAPKALYEIGEIPPLGHVPEKMYAWAIRKERHGPPETVDADRGAADLADRRRRGAGPRDGGGRELQRRVGGARHAGLADRRPQESLSHRGLRRVRHRLGGRRQGEALEGRRRSHRPLQSGRRRRRRLQWRRSAALALAAHLGLRDAGRLVRAILPRAVAPADGEAEASHLGRVRPATR